MENFRQNFRKNLDKQVDAKDEKENRGSYHARLVILVIAYYFYQAIAQAINRRKDTVNEAFVNLRELLQSFQVDYEPIEIGGNQSEVVIVKFKVRLNSVIKGSLF